MWLWTYTLRGERRPHIPTPVYGAEIVLELLEVERSQWIRHDFWERIWPVEVDLADGMYEIEPQFFHESRCQGSAIGRFTPYG